MDFSNYKIILWGHKLHSHTHGYVHYAFHKAAKHMGYQSYWFDNNDDVKEFDFSNSIFITEGQVDQNIPIRKDCYYVLHNCYDNKYKELYESKNAITLQVYTNDILKYNLKKIEDCIYFDHSGRCLYFPWATDLLPHEIDLNRDNYKNFSQNEIHWIGTVGAGQFGNINEINPFIKACYENNVKFNQTTLIEFDKNLELIKKSYMAPTITGTWQTNVGYIPCRIFKNISYGHIGMTNSSTVNKLFNDSLIYNPNTYNLFYDGKRFYHEINKEKIHKLMDFVKEKHTYINRINTILTFLNESI